MIHQKGDKINSLGTTLIIVLFLFLFSSFSKSTKQADHASRFELKILSHPGQLKAVITDAVQLPSIQKSNVPEHHDLFSDTHKVFAENRKIAQSIILLQKTQLSIKPMTFCRFYYHLSAKDDEDLPVLS
jgi:hypothetical protein